MMGVASELGYEATFCGAFREEGLEQDEQWGGWHVVRLGRHFPLLSGRRPMLYLTSIFRFNRDLYRFLKRNRPELVHASDIETVPAAILYRMWYGTRLIYNIHDNLAQRYNVPSAFAFLLNVLEGLCVRAADATVVPEDFRRAALPRWCQRKVSIVRNTPEDAGFSAPDLDGETIRIFFGGWLDWGRGLRALITIAEQCADVELRVAGDGAHEIVAQLEDNPRVVYLGFVAHDVVMEETRRCHFVAALYDPARQINRYAASNKLAEALAVGRPVIINSEMQIGRTLSPRNCLVVTDYDKADTLGKELRALRNNREAFLSACDSARQIYEAQYAWEPVRERIRSVLSLDKANS